MVGPSLNFYHNPFDSLIQGVLFLQSIYIYIYIYFGEIILIIIWYVTMCASKDLSISKLVRVFRVNQILLEEN